MGFSLSRTLMLSLFALATSAWCQGIHYSCQSDNPHYFTKSIRAHTKAPLLKVPVTNVRAVIITHHLLASKLIVDFFESIRTKPIKRIVLIGPNHYNSGFAPISFSLRPWKTPFGMIDIDSSDIRDAMKELSVSEDPLAFAGEHSIGAIVPFIKYYFPHVVTLPVTLRKGLTDRYTQRFSHLVDQWISDSSTLIILSMDFSHKSVLSIADQRDSITQHIITRCNWKAADSAFVDCPIGLKALLCACKKLSIDSVQIFAHDNSQRIGHRIRQPDVTTYMTVIFSVKKPRPAATIEFVGDIMLGRGVEQIISRKGPSYIVDPVKPFLTSANLVIGNLECPLTECVDTLSKHVYNAIYLKAPPKNAEVLRTSGITAVSIANNHSMDFGECGLRQTIRVLDSNNIRFAGVNSSPSGSNKASLLKVNGLKILWASYLAHPRTQGTFLHSIRDKDKSDLPICQTDYDSLPIIVGKLKKRCEILILSLHWGDEYSVEPSEKQIRVARACIDSGATIIAGHHPHVLQPIERYHGGVIFYSLGNFIFDSAPEETRLSMIARCRIRGDRDVDSLVVLHTIADHGRIRPLDKTQ